MQILGGRIIDVCRQRAGIFQVHGAIQAFQIALDALVAIPADDCEGISLPIE